MLASIPMLILQEYLMYLVQAHYGFSITNLVVAHHARPST